MPPTTKTCPWVLTKIAMETRVCADVATWDMYNSTSLSYLTKNISEQVQPATEHSQKQNNKLVYIFKHTKSLHN